MNLDLFYLSNAVMLFFNLCAFILLSSAVDKNRQDIQKLDSYVLNLLKKIDKLESEK
jgi:hypothetical protein